MFGIGPSKILLVGEIRRIKCRCWGYTTVSHAQLFNGATYWVASKLDTIHVWKAIPFDIYFSLCPLGQFFLSKFFFSGKIIWSVFKISLHGLKLVVLNTEMAKCREKIYQVLGRHIAPGPAILLVLVSVLYSTVNWHTGTPVLWSFDQAEIQKRHHYFNEPCSVWPFNKNTRMISCSCSTEAERRLSTSSIFTETASHGTWINRRINRCLSLHRVCWWHILYSTRRIQTTGMTWVLLSS